MAKRTRERALGRARVSMSHPLAMPPARERHAQKEGELINEILLHYYSPDRPAIGPTTHARAVPAQTPRTPPSDLGNRVSGDSRARGSSAPMHKFCARRSSKWRVRDPFGS